MTEKPIITSAESVRAILAGRKTQTRRVIKPPLYREVGGDIWYWKDDRLPTPKDCPYQVGDRLWVRETWKKSLHGGEYDADGAEYVHDCPGYKADGKYRCGKPVNDLEYGWRSPIHMPRWASRLTLEVTGIRVERLQEITDTGGMYEGWQCDPFNLDYLPRMWYRDRWDALNAKRGYPWDANPWVWVITFKVVTL